jgi:hypothetical protein
LGSKPVFIHKVNGEDHTYKLPELSLHS